MLTTADLLTIPTQRTFDGSRRSGGGVMWQVRVGSTEMEGDAGRGDFEEQDEAALASAVLAPPG